MAEWVSHLIVADRVLEILPQLSRHEFVGFSRKEYEGFLDRAVNNVINAIEALVLRQMERQCIE